MKKLIVLVGPSGSGKSTWAHEQVFELGAKYCTIVNRDKIRELIFGYTEETVHNHYTSKSISQLEKEVTKYEDLLIKEGLNDNKTVIVDATHLKRQFLVRLKRFNVPVELKFFDTIQETSISRDLRRTRQVGKNIISKQYRDFKSLRDSLISKPIDFTVKTLELNPELPKCVLVDLDGTIAHMNGGRSPYDWKKVGQDSLDSSVFSIIDSIDASNVYGREHNQENIEIIICTGRDGECEQESKDWCSKNDIPYKEFHIRTPKDQRPDWVVKEEMWRDISTRYNIIGLFDDRCQVVDRARSLGLKVFQVEYHNF